MTVSCSPNLLMTSHEQRTIMTTSFICSFKGNQDSYWEETFCSCEGVPCFQKVWEQLTLNTHTHTHNTYRGNRCWFGWDRQWRAFCFLAPCELGRSILPKKSPTTKTGSTGSHEGRFIFHMGTREWVSNLNFNQFRVNNGRKKKTQVRGLDQCGFIRANIDTDYKWSRRSLTIFGADSAVLNSISRYYNFSIFIFRFFTPPPSTFIWQL